MRILFFYSIISVVLIGCGEKYYLSEEEIALNPYMEGDVVIFQANTGELDTVQVSSIKKEFPVDAGPLKYYEQSLDVNVEGLSLPWLTITTAYPRDSARIVFRVGITPNSESNKPSWDRKTAISFWSSLLRGLSIEEFNSRLRKEVTINSIEFADVIVIDENIEKGGMIKYTAADKVYWSFSKGLVRIERDDGLYWELIHFYRDGKDIIAK